MTKREKELIYSKFIWYPMWLQTHPAKSLDDEKHRTMICEQLMNDILWIQMEFPNLGQNLYTLIFNRHNGWHIKKVSTDIELNKEWNNIEEYVLYNNKNYDSKTITDTDFQKLFHEITDYISSIQTDDDLNDDKWEHPDNNGIKINIVKTTKMNK